jgi:hypothetical protein
MKCIYIISIYNIQGLFFIQAYLLATDPDTEADTA